MAAIDNIVVDDLGPGLEGFGQAALEDLKERFTRQVKRQGWRWFQVNRDKVLFSKRIFLWNVKLRVRDFEFLAVELLGPEPVVTL